MAAGVSLGAWALVEGAMKLVEGSVGKHQGTACHHNNPHLRPEILGLVMPGGHKRAESPAPHWQGRVLSVSLVGSPGTRISSVVHSVGCMVAQKAAEVSLGLGPLLLALQ